jgi:hypothetical protein
MSISLSFPDQTYTSDNKPSTATLKSDLTGIENEINSHEADTSAHVPIATILDTIYPIGSIYSNAAVSTNPATLLGFGTWTAFAPGKVIIGIDGTDTDFDSLSDTGGAKTATLGITNLPAHDHTGSTAANESAHTHTGTTGTESATHTHNEIRGIGTDRQSPYYNNPADTDKDATSGPSTTTESATHTHTITTAAGSAHTHALTIASQGSGTAFSILNPYVTAYCWKRTA